MNNGMCMMCKVSISNDQSILNLKKIIEFLKRKDLDINIVKKIDQFRFESSTRCRIGVSGCDKIKSIKREIQRLSKEADLLLSAYIEQSNDFDDVHNIYMYMRGYFPAAYRQLEIQIRQRGGN